MPEMTQKTYVQTNGEACPKCGLNLIRVDGAMTRGGELREAIECTACLTKYERVYRLQGYKLL